MNTHVGDKTVLIKKRLAIHDLFNNQYDLFRALERANACLLLEHGITEAQLARDMRAVGFRSIHWMLWAMRKGRNNQEYVIRGRKQLGTIPTIRLVALAAYWDMTMDEMAAYGRARLNEQAA